MRILLLLTFFIFIPKFNLIAQTNDKKEAKYIICLYRENRKEGKWVKQEIFIDSISYLKIGNKSRAIFDINTNIGNTLGLRVYYSSLGQKREKNLLLPIIQSNDTIYIKSFFNAESFNPLKHYGTGKKPEFSVDAIVMNKEMGKAEFENDKYFNDEKQKKIKRLEVE